MFLDRTMLTVTSITAFVAALLLAQVRVVQDAPLEDWWLPVLLAVIGVALGALAWTDERLDQQTADESETTSLTDKVEAAAEEAIQEDAVALTDKVEAAVEEAVETDATSLTEKVEEAVAADDLTKIEGIGPKMADALRAAGYDSFEKIAAASQDDLSSAIQDAGLIPPAGMATWDEQASLAARGNWETLDALQDKLSAGRGHDRDAAQADDLTRIEGVGPKMSQALIGAGLTTFAKIAAASEDDLRAAVEAAGMRLAPSIPTWAEQATLAAKGDWDVLETLQGKLKGGRRK